MVELERETDFSSYVSLGWKESEREWEKANESNK